MSLRTRILVAFVVLGVLLAPLLAGLILYVTHESSEDRVEARLRDTLSGVIASPESAGLRTPPGHPRLHIAGLDDAESPAGQLTGLSAGIHEIKLDGRPYYIAIADREGERYALARPATAMEAHEGEGIGAIIAAALATVYLALSLGYWLSRRLVAPLSGLATAVDSLPPDSGPTRFAEALPSDEVGQLGRAVDRYTERLHAFVEREQQFAADASHELRNPLAVIRGAAEILQTDRDLAPRNRRAAERIVRACRQMDETVSALLLIARESRSPAESQDRTAVAPLVAEAIADTRHLLGDRAVTIEYVTEASPELAAPPVAVQVLASNLLRNAFGYTPRGRVTVRLKADRLVVEDTGIGIPAAELASVTGRGIRASNAGGAGSGLGLSIARRLCERFGWRLEMTSEEGSGTRVTWLFGAARA
ncbi:MAG: HAMP domain-containing sensor histidine kinase [Ectothiorhodospiraceae bacterium]|jgi:signal transduction histidine kinase